MKRKRLYSFTDDVPATSSNTTVTVPLWRMTVEKPNPFRGLDRWVFAIDEWGHRNLSPRFHRLVFGWLCNWWDRRLWPPPTPTSHTERTEGSDV